MERVKGTLIGRLVKLIHRIVNMKWSLEVFEGVICVDLLPY